jgi:hypothetical protein
LRLPSPYDGGEIPVSPEDRSWLAEETTKNVERGSWVPAAAKPAYGAPAFVMRRDDG